MMVYWSITGFACDPGDVSKCLALDPTATWRIGDRIGSSVRQREHNGWRLQSPFDESASLEDHVRWLLDRVTPRYDALPAVAGPHDSELACVLHLVDRAPELHLEAATLERMVALKTELDVDIYLLPAEAVADVSSDHRQDR